MFYHPSWNLTSDGNYTKGDIHFGWDKDKLARLLVSEDGFRDLVIFRLKIE